MKKLRKEVFWPPFLLLTTAVVFSLVDSKSFLKVMQNANNWIMAHFGWLFSLTSLSMLLCCLALYFSPLGKVRIGGKNAKPLLSKWRWFSITLCTTVAIGIIFWGTAEPLYHLMGPPPETGATPGSPQAARFALSTLFMHWTFTPYSIYTIPTVLFALAFYNRKEKFSLGSPLSFLSKKWLAPKPSSFIDSLCLFSMVAGMAASLGSGILTLSGGMQSLFGWESSPLLTALITFSIVACFSASSATGLMKGIRILSNANVRIFFFLAAFVFVCGPTLFILNFGLESLGEYLQNFFTRSLSTGASTQNSWPQSWTLFYWANWMAWAPITSLFLGRLSVGYTVRDLLRVNLLYPSLFGIVWMSIFSGTVLHMESIKKLGLYEALQTKGPESVIYVMLENLPLGALISIVFFLTSFLSYVTAADSNTEALGAISSTGIKADNPNPGTFIKIIWGSSIGLIAWIMITYAGIDGMKMMSNLGGLPALFLLTLTTVGAIKLLIESKKTTWNENMLEPPA